MKVTDHIKQDHEEMLALFEEFEKKPSKRIVKEIGEILLPHHHAEEEVVFPGVAEASAQKAELVADLIAEHGVIDRELEEILETPVGDELFEAKVRVWKEIVEHHLDEEEGVFFPHLEEVYSDSELTAMNKEFEAAEDEYDPEIEDGEDEE